MSAPPRRLIGARRVLAALALLAAVPAAAQAPVQKIQLLPAASLASLAWRSIATDPQGDGLHPRLPDAKELFYAVDAKADVVWFKVTLYDPLPERWFGMNVAIDIDDKPDNGMAWWGTNKIKFDRLGSAYLFKAEDHWQGVAGVADSDGAAKTLFTNMSRDAKVAIDRDQRAILLGLPRATLGAAATVRVIATVGSMLVNNDDIPNEGAVTVALKP